MNKDWIKSYWSNCLSITAIICSIVAICVSLPSTQELGIDYIGVIVGILSFLVTILIGWQIYNAIIIEKKIKEETGKLKKEISDYLENDNGKRDSLSMYVLGLTHARIALIENDYEDAFACFINALHSVIQIDENEECIENALHGVHSLAKKAIEKNIPIPIDADRKDEYIETLKQVKDKRAIEVINYIYSRFE